MRIARRLARATLMLDVCAHEYGLEPTQLLGPRRGGWRYEAQAVATRLMRSVSYLHPRALAEMLECSEHEIAQRWGAVARWRHTQQGDIRIVDRIARIRAAYDRQKEGLVVHVKPYDEYTDAQRLPGTRFANQYTRQRH